jgi:Putative metallopeptidase
MKRPLTYAFVIMVLLMPGTSRADDGPAASSTTPVRHGFVLQIEAPSSSIPAVYLHNHAGSTVRKTLIQRYIASLNSEYAMKRDIPVVLRPCGSGEVTGYYASSHRILLCDDLMDQFFQADVLKHATWVDPSKAAELGVQFRLLFATYAMYFVFLHEVAHALIAEFDIAVPGNQEYLADEFAALYAIDHDQEHDSTSSAIQAQLVFENLPDFGVAHTALSDYFDLHPYSEQRYVHIRCILTGQNPSYSVTVGGGEFSADQIRECKKDYRKKVRDWNRLLKPYRRN